MLLAFQLILDTNCFRQKNDMNLKKMFGFYRNGIIVTLHEYENILNLFSTLFDKIKMNGGSSHNI